MESITHHLRNKLVEIAQRDVGLQEAGYNRGDHIRKYWPATSYPAGYKNREPYCAAFICYIVRQWLLDAAVLAALRLDAKKAELWRCKSAAAFGWREWAKKNKVRILPASADVQVGDLMIFEFSHIGIVITDACSEQQISTIEANTGDGNDRDGKYVSRRVRSRDLAACFIRLMD